MDDIINHFIGGAIRDYNVFLFFAIILAVFIVIWLVPKFSLRDVWGNLLFELNVFLVVYMSIVLIINYGGLSIWFAFALDMGYTAALVLIAKRFKSIYNLTVALHLASLSGATLVYFLTYNQNILLRVVLIVFAQVFFNIATHTIYNVMMMSEETAKKTKLNGLEGISRKGVTTPNVSNDTLHRQKTAPLMDLPKLAEQLSELRTILKKDAADEPEHDLAIGAVASAEIEAKLGNQSEVLTFLAQAGEWALRVAIGTNKDFAAAAIKQAQDRNNQS